MTVCSSCKAEIQGEASMCKSCVQDKITAIWKRQIRSYSLAVVIGTIVLLYDIAEVRALPHGASGIPAYLIAATAVGGLAVTGGLFGLALAIFFNAWHTKKAA